MIKEAIHSLLSGSELRPEEVREVMTEMMEGHATPAQMSAFLTAMRLKGETIDEITACASVLREKCVKLKPETDVLDIVGTSGDPSENAKIARDVLSGKKCAKSDIVALNAAMCLHMAFGNTTLRQCVKMAQDLISSGKARDKMEAFVAATNEASA
jgi:anthranilate phosphoribosyltransferase